MSEQRRPYVGPRPFEKADRDVFFGRRREARELKARVIAHPLVLLYAPSGAGKTSLINAALNPELMAEGFDVLPPTRVSHARLPDEGPPESGNVFAAGALSNLYGALRRGSAEALAPRGDETVGGYLQRFPRSVDELGEPRPLALIIDQMEELFSTHPERWPERRGFLEQLSEVAERVPLVRILLAMREDYIAHLDPYLGIFPDRLRIRMRLELLRESEAVTAVKGPLEVAGRRFGEGVAEKIVSELLQVRTRNEKGEADTVTGEFVEPVQLQVVCQSLWDSLPLEVEVVDEARLSTIGDVDQALGTFYEDAIRRAIQEKKGNEEALRRWIDDKLITPAGTRGLVNEQDPQTAALPAGVVDLLVSRHLVRGEERYGSRWFELAHDRFLKPIQDSNLKFRQSRQTRLEDKERSMAVGAILAPALAGYLLFRESGSWITILALLFSAVYGGFNLGTVVRKVRAHVSALTGASGVVRALGVLVALGAPLLGGIVAEAWWYAAGYLVLLGVYAALGQRFMEEESDQGGLSPLLGERT